MASTISDLLECPICLDIFDDPKVLDCQHTFCCKCLQRHQSASSRGLFMTSSISCPNCRMKTNLLNHSVVSLPGNYIVRNIIQRQYGNSTPERASRSAQQVQDQINQMEKENNQFDWVQYVKPAGVALVGVLSGLLLAKGVNKMRENDRK